MIGTSDSANWYSKYILSLVPVPVPSGRNLMTPEIAFFRIQKVKRNCRGIYSV
jgi:hypothetical protein